MGLSLWLLPLLFTDLTRLHPLANRVDRHLFALRSIAQKHGEVPDIFKDKGLVLHKSFAI